MGGPASLTEYPRRLGDQVTRLDRMEPQLNAATPGDPRDTTTPFAMLEHMNHLLLGDGLGEESRAKLIDWLVASVTGRQKLRAGLHAAWKVGDKTGTASDSGTANDIAVLWPPGGGAPVVVTCYLTRSKVSPEQRDAAIAQVARAVVAARQG